MAKGNRRSKNVTTSGFEAVRNENLYKDMLELRRSSAASKHVSVKRKGSRNANKQKAIASFM